MPIAVHCQSCGHQLEVSRQHAGREGHCPRCRAALRVPTLKEAQLLSLPSDRLPVTELFPASQSLSGGQTIPGDVQRTASGGETLAGPATPEIVRQRWQRAYGLGDDERDLDPGQTFRPPLLPETEAATVGLLNPASAPSANSPKVSGTPAESFELIDELGRGGMGVVYRARDPELKRQVAIKRLLGHGGGAQRKAFLAEAFITAGLDHPNIVPVYRLRQEAGEIELAMKIVGGASWKELLHPTSPEAKARAAGKGLADQLGILLSVCNAVAFAHSRGIAHLDLKPENVMVGEFGEVLLMDWGIAVSFRERSEASRHLRNRSEIRSPCGTPSYMAPELAEGEGGQIGPWTDVYLLGAILHELLTGQAPHSGRGFYQAIYKALEGKPPRFDQSVPGELQEICRRALATEPGARFESVEALREAVENYLRHRDSLEVSTRARGELTSSLEVELGEEVSEGERNALYTGFARAIAGFEQALLLWEGNQEARGGLKEAQEEYARAALHCGDLGLAEAQAAGLGGDEDAQALREEIDEAIEEKAIETRQNRRVRQALGVGGFVFVAGTVLALGLILREKGKAEQSATEARANARRAEVSANEARSNAEEARANEKRAEANAEEARRSLAEIRRVADAVPARLLREEIDSLWPEVSAQAPKLESWLSAVRTLLSRQSGHETALAKLSSSELDKGESREDRARRLKTLGGVFAELKKLRGQVPELEGRLGVARGMRAKTLEGDAGRAWERALRSIANRSECPAYGGLTLKPIEGLIPLSRNDRTGLWEFWHVRSGKRPQKKGGRWKVQEKTGLVFVLIPAGRYMMGSDKGLSSERPVHWVSVRAFFVSKYELTQGQWARMMGRNPSTYGPGKLGATLAHPVEQVSWRDGCELAKRFGLRLPSEAQWEYAARAGTVTEWWTGSEKSSLRGAANLADESYREGGGTSQIEAWTDGYLVHAPVGRYLGNPWGLFDTAGNVWEWCQDDWANDYRGGPNNDQPHGDGSAAHRVYRGGPNNDQPHGDGSAAHRVYRGGSWGNGAAFLRSAFRFRFEPGYRSHDLGLRLARSLDP